MPLTFLDHRLVVGDSLTGPFWDKLLFSPSDPKSPVKDLFSQGIYDKLRAGLTDRTGARSPVGSLDRFQSRGVDRQGSDQSPARRALLPFKVAVAAWAGGVMLGRGACDDLAYGSLLKTIGETGMLPNDIESEALRAEIARGLGLESVPSDRPSLEAMVVSPLSVPALAYDLTFPEVFYPFGVPSGRQGFHAVLGNPPWDAVRPKAKEFFAAFDFEILAAPTKRERAVIEQRLNGNPEIKARHKRYIAEIDGQQLIHDVLFEYQVALVNGAKSGGDPDLAKLFLELIRVSCSSLTVT